MSNLNNSNIKTAQKKLELNNFSKKLQTSIFSNTKTARIINPNTSSNNLSFSKNSKKMTFNEVDSVSKSNKFEFLNENKSNNKAHSTKNFSEDFEIDSKESANRIQNLNFKKNSASSKNIIATNQSKIIPKDSLKTEVEYLNSQSLSSSNNSPSSEYFGLQKDARILKRTKTVHSSLSEKPKAQPRKLLLETFKGTKIIGEKKLFVFETVAKFEDNKDDISCSVSLQINQESSTTINTKTNYFPKKSQYRMGPFIFSFFKKAKEELARKALSFLISNPQLNKPEIEKQIRDMTGLKFSHPFIKETNFKDGMLINVREYKSLDKKSANFEAFKTEIVECNNKLAEVEPNGQFILAICRETLSSDITGTKEPTVSKPLFYFTK